MPEGEGGWVVYCDKCGKKFNSLDAVTISYNEYGEGLTNSENVSPCCGCGFSDSPLEEVNK